MTFIADSPAYVNVNIFRAEMYIWKQWCTTSCKQNDKFVIQAAFCCLHLISISSVDISDGPICGAWVSWKGIEERVSYHIGTCTLEDYDMNKRIEKYPNLPSICDVVIL